MTVQSIERVFDILEALSHEPTGVNLTEIGRRLDLHKSTVHRLINVLKKRGYIDKDDATGKYRLGPGFVELAGIFLNSIELKTEAEPHLRQLSKIVGQTVFLATLGDGEVVYIDKVEQYNSLRKYSIIGYRRPLYCTSLGKALLMHKTDDEVREQFRGVVFQRHTLTTLPDVDSLLADLAGCRKRGWTLDNSEIEEDVRCVGAPILDYRSQVVAALSVSWNVFSNPPVPEEVARHVLEAARAISRRLGYPGGRGN